MSLPDSAAPRRRRLEPGARRDQILACAVTLFGERPFAAVSTAAIAREAGVARGLLNHYFGTKRELYLEVVRRMVAMPGIDLANSASGSLTERIARSVEWYLDVVSAHGATFVAVIGAEGIGADPDIERILAEADDRAAQAVLDALDLRREPVGRDEEQRAALRAYGGLAKAAVREWLRDGSLHRDQVRLLLSTALTSIVVDVLPTLVAAEAGTAG